MARPKAVLDEDASILRTDQATVGPKSKLSDESGVAETDALSQRVDVADTHLRLKLAVRAGVGTEGRFRPRDQRDQTGPIEPPR
jgi:hypothetical protein